MDKTYSRRQFFRLIPRGAIDAVRDSRSGQPKYFRPPGAIENDEDFIKTCEKCKKCAEACPHEVIDHLGVQAGEAENTPIIDPGEKPCHWCPTMDCVKACPSGALSFGQDGTIAPIGKAEIDLSTCVTPQGILCDFCASCCPTHVKAIVMVNRTPQVREELCVGCGLCVYHCDSIPLSIKIMKNGAS